MPGPGDNGREGQGLRDILARAGAGEGQPDAHDRATHDAMADLRRSKPGRGGKPAFPAWLWVAGGIVAIAGGAGLLAYQRQGATERFHGVMKAIEAASPPTEAAAEPLRDRGSASNASPTEGWSEMANRLASPRRPPRLEIDNVQAVADAGPIDLAVRIEAPGAQPGELRVVIAGLPADLSPSRGERQPDGTWLMGADAASDLKLSNPGKPAQLQLTVSLVGPDGRAILARSVTVAVYAPETKSPFGKNASEDDARTLFEQGKLRLAEGDVVGGRMFFKKAADGGDAQAAIALGATYDPALFSQLGVKGMHPDVEMARRWYQRAADLGSKDALDRIDRLDQK
jgi:hypothetical protein